jgi:hypothetical protein
MTPVLMVEAGNHKLLLHKQEIRLRAAAALAEEPDLLSYSLKHISENTSQEAIDTYLLGYGKDNFSQDIKSVGVYQIALIYMSRLNEERDDEKAKLYLQRHLIEFPYSILQDRIFDRLEILQERKKETVRLSPKKILAQYDTTELMNKPIITFDPDLTPISQRAIVQNRMEDANSLYGIVYDNPGSTDKIRAKSLYQLGLIYMSPHNKEANLQKSIRFFRKIIEEFPDSPIARKAEHKITLGLNRRPKSVE